MLIPLYLLKAPDDLMVALSCPWHPKIKVAELVFAPPLPLVHNIAQANSSAGPLWLHNPELVLNSEAAQPNLLQFEPYHPTVSYPTPIGATSDKCKCNGRVEKRSHLFPPIA